MVLPASFAAAAAAPRRFEGLTDSKRLSAPRRERFLDLLLAEPGVEIGIGRAGVEEIDRLNILRATHLAMARAVRALAGLPDFVLVDGRPVRGLPCPAEAIVRGDSASLSIAAASVAAKVTRDRVLVELDRLYPGYGFADHKGYGTARHLAALRRLGACPAHRRSFAPVAAALGRPPPRAVPRGAGETAP